MLKSLFVLVLFLFTLLGISIQGYSKDHLQPMDSSCTPGGVKATIQSENRPNVEIMDQGSTGTCFGHAGWFAFQQYLHRFSDKKDQVSITDFILKGSNKQCLDYGNPGISNLNVRNQLLRKEENLKIDKVWDLDKCCTSPYRSIATLSTAISNVFSNHKEMSKKSKSFFDQMAKESIQAFSKDPSTMAFHTLNRVFEEVQSQPTITVPPYNIHLFHPKQAEDFIAPLSQQAAVPVHFCLHSEEGVCQAYHVVTVLGLQEFDCNGVTKRGFEIMNSHGERAEFMDADLFLEGITQFKGPAQGAIYLERCQGEDCKKSIIPQDKNEEPFIAAATGNHELFEEVKNNIPSNAVDAGGNSKLIYAIIGGNFETFLSSYNKEIATLANHEGLDPIGFLLYLNSWQGYSRQAMLQHLLDHAEINWHQKTQYAPDLYAAAERATQFDGKKLILDHWVEEIMAKKPTPAQFLFEMLRFADPGFVSDHIENIEDSEFREAVENLQEDPTGDFIIQLLKSTHSSRLVSSIFVNWNPQSLPEAKEVLMTALKRKHSHLDFLFFNVIQSGMLSKVILEDENVPFIVQSSLPMLEISNKVELASLFISPAVNLSNEARFNILIEILESIQQEEFRSKFSDRVYPIIKESGVLDRLLEKAPHLLPLSEAINHGDYDVLKKLALKAPSYLANLKKTKENLYALIMQVLDKGPREPNST